jgi:Peptidase family M28
VSAPIVEKFWYSTVFVALLALLVVSFFFAQSRLGTMETRPVEGSSNFSATHAVKVLHGLLGDESPHPVDSRANQGVRQRIVDSLSALGYHVEVQDVTSCRDAVDTCARVRNIVAVHVASANSKAILLSAHYDSVPAGPGASDDGAGVAILLEIARLMKNGPPGKNSVVFLFTEGEEAGLLGAEAFESRHPLANNVAFVINIEARGTSGQSVMFETGPRSGWLVDKFFASSRRPLANSLISAVYTMLPNDTDLSVFKARGLQGLNFAYGEHLTYYHTPLDNLHHLDAGSLQQQGDNVFCLLKNLINSDLQVDQALESGVYTDVLGFVTLHWSNQSGAVVTCLLILMFSFASCHLKKRRMYSRRSVASGCFGFIASLLVGIGAAFCLTSLLSMVNGATPVWHASSASNRTFLWSAVLLSVLSTQRLFAARRDPIGLWIGLGWAWLFMALITAIALPGVSYIFILPSIGLVSCTAMALMPVLGSSDKRLYWLFMIPAVVGYAIIIPAIYLIEIMIGFNGVAGVASMAAFLAMATTFLLPFAQSGRATSVHVYTSYIGLAVVVISGALCFHAPAYTTEQPQALNIMYVEDSHGQGLVVAGNTYSPPPGAILRAMGGDVTQHAVLPWSKSNFYSVSVPAVGLPIPTFKVVKRTMVSGGWQITGRIDGGERASMIRLLVPAVAGLQSIEVDGQRLNYSKRSGDYAWFTCRGESCRNREITMILSDQGHEAMIIAATSDLPQVAARVAHGRGSLAIPSQDGDQSLVWREIRL